MPEATDRPALNAEGLEKLERIRANVRAFASKLEALCGADGEEMIMAQMALEEVLAYASAAMASRPENQAPPAEPPAP